MPRMASSSGSATSEPGATIVLTARSLGEPRCYPRRTVRLIEIRQLDGPNLYRLEPAMKLEVAIGRRRTWYGKREPEAHALVRLAAPVPRSAQQPRIAALADWIRRLRRAAPDGSQGPVTVHRSSDPGHWIVVWPWALGDRAKGIAEGALELVERDVQPKVGARLTPR